MATIRKHVDKKGQVRRYVYERINGKWICEKAGIYKEDALKLKNKLEKQKMDAKESQCNIRATLWGYCDLYETLPVEREAGTKELICREMRRIKKFFDKKTLVKDVAAQNAEAYLKFLYDVEKLCHTTAHISMRNFRGVMYLAKRDGIIEKENPLKQVVIKMKLPKPRVIFLTAAQKEKIFETVWKLKLRPKSIHQQMMDMIKVFLNTGLRRAEVLNLRKEHMVGSNHITIPSREKESQLEETKNSDPYTIPLNSEILPIFQAVKEGRIFPWNKNTFNKRFQALFEKAGLPHVTPHGFRHTFASDALDRGVPIDIVSKMLNHSSIQLTLTYYGHRRKGHLDASFEALATPPQLKVA